MINLNAITFLCALGISLIITASIIGYIIQNDNFNATQSQKDVRETVQNNNPSSEDTILNYQKEKPLLQLVGIKNLEKSGIKKNNIQ
jgi:hypothetical protein